MTFHIVLHNILQAQLLKGGGRHCCHYTVWPLCQIRFSVVKMSFKYEYYDTSSVQHPQYCRRHTNLSVHLTLHLSMTSEQDHGILELLHLGKQQLDETSSLCKSVLLTYKTSLCPHKDRRTYTHVPTVCVHFPCNYSFNQYPLQTESELQSHFYLDLLSLCSLRTDRTERVPEE